MTSFFSVQSNGPMPYTKVNQRLALIHIWSNLKGALFKFTTLKERRDELGSD